MGLTAHAMARELQVQFTAGAFAALAHGVNGVVTAVALVPLCWVWCTQYKELP